MRKRTTRIIFPTKRRNPRKTGWKYIRNKESKYFDEGFIYEIRFRPQTMNLTWPIDKSNIQRPSDELIIKIKNILGKDVKFLRSWVHKYIKENLVVYLKSETDLLLLKLAEVNEVFRIYSLTKK